jgi:hypothetical protein
MNKGADKPKQGISLFRLTSEVSTSEHLEVVQDGRMSWVWWFIPVITATQEMDAGRAQVQVYLGQN